MIKVLKISKKSQSIMEFSLLIALVISVYIGMQIYIKRGLQGRLKDASDDFALKMESDIPWADISTASATLDGQFEDADISGRRTTIVSTDKETFSMDKGANAGAVTKNVEQEYSQQAGDYQRHE